MWVDGVKRKHENVLAAGAEASIAAGAAAILEGKLVAFPTDTVYGLGSTPFSEDAIRLIFAAKRRPLDKGIPVLLAEKDDVRMVTSAIPQKIEALMECFWPGALTLVLPKKDGLPASLSANDGVAVRVPDHPVTRSLIRQAGGAIAASSANRSGLTPAQTAAEVWEQLGSELAWIIDGGPTAGHSASTVIDCRQWPPLLLRAGPISLADLRQSVQVISQNE